jgi:serine/threonine-protein kinase HipA
MSTITKLDVIYAGWGERWQLGTLAQSGQRLLFEYSAQAIEAAAHRNLQLSPIKVPVPASGAGQAGYSGPRHLHGLPGFIADALPDGWGMLLMDRAFRKAGRDVRSISVLERLAVVGDSAVGALSFEPADPIEARKLDAISLKKLALQSQDVLADDAEKTSQEQLRQLLMLGGSPQGARPKALLRFNEGAERFYPDGAGVKAGVPWLLKFPAQGEAAHVCALEQLYARLARKGGMDMPASRYFPLGAKHAAFGVQRFDRVASQAGDEQRVPVLSMAALLDADFRLPALDYETVLLATHRLTGDYRETLKAFNRCVFNVLTHNRDDHAKNFAFILVADDQWRLSPAFDLTFSFGPGGEHSTSIAGEGRLPTRDHLMRVAKVGGIKEKDAAASIKHWLEMLQTDMLLLRDLPIPPKTLIHIRTTLSAVWQAMK